VRILVWHGWLLDGTGSNIYTAKAAEAWRRHGHEVVLVCQDPRAARIPFVDAVTTADGSGVREPEVTLATAAPGSVTVVRPDIGDLLPVFVFDEYEGFRVKTFVDLSERELDDYLQRNVAALRAVASWRPHDVAIAGHAVPGAVVARRALGRGYVAKIHGSDLEYAIRLQDRYRQLAEEGLSAAGVVAGASDDVLARTVTAVPSVAGRTRRVEPGVEVDRWRPVPRPAALEIAATRLEGSPETSGGRPASLDRSVAERLEGRDGGGLDAIARSYDQRAPDPDAAGRLRSLGAHRGPLIGYLGKLIPQKGVERLIEAMALLGTEARAVIVGFGLFREWLAALVLALDRGDPAAASWLGESSPMRLELGPEEVRRAPGLGRRISFTGRLDHRFAPEVVAALDVLVVPSTLEEAFGMVAAEGAAAGALPVVARHSSLAEVAAALEGAAGRPGLLSFEPGPGATRRLAGVLEEILALPAGERAAARERVRQHVATEWTWDRTAERLLAAGIEARNLTISVDPTVARRSQSMPER
jgi:glycosyltransferase involved in cell wall biosynthesis